jgi:hypothetical protein
MLKPKSVLPTSPIKIFAGCQFHIRNPPVIIANNSGRNVPYKRNEANPMNITSTLIYPSIPSRKLKRFVNHTIPITDRTLNTNGTESCVNPISTLFKPPRKKTAIEADIS